jgi:hypothetical protein
MQPIFWAAQVVPLLGLLAFGGWKLREARIGNRAAQRIAALQSESAALTKKLRHGGPSPQEYYANASRAVRLKTALATNVDPNTVDFETTVATFHLGDNDREQVRKLFERSDELQYSGAATAAGMVSRDERRDVVELIESLRA